MNMQETLDVAKNWVLAAGENLKNKLENPLIIETKTSATDLVTNLDKETETFLIEKIRSQFPEDSILGEEGLADETPNLEGRVWVIDPIDGTLNFVKQRENFCIMLALFEKGKGKLGFIYNVMRNELYYGGADEGVFLNDQKLQAPKNQILSEGLLGMNAYIYGHNRSEALTIGEKSAGVRISGCAGIEFIEILKGNQVGYFSKLAPWDYAAGLVLLEELGLQATQLSGEKLDLSGKALCLAATPAAYQEIIEIYQKNQKKAK